MKPFRLFATLIALALLWTLPGEGAAAKPKIMNPRQLDAMFTDEDSVDRYLQQGRSPERLFNASMYYFLNLVDVLDKLDKGKGPRKRLLDATIDMLEEARRVDDQNPIYAGFLGNAYGLKVTFSGFPALLVWAKKCQTEVNRAVRISNGDPEVRLLRLRSLVHFPYQYYRELRDQNVDDANAVLAWIGEVEAAGRSDPAMKSLYDGYLVDLKNEVYLIMGQYFDEQAKDRELAVSYLSKADANCWKSCAKARALLAKIK